MSTHQPALRAFTLIKREGQDDVWLAIGAAFAHEKGGGFNLILQALPLSNGDGTCKIVFAPVSFPLFQGMRFGGSRIEFSFCMVILLGLRRATVMKRRIA
jgi:hypothetical protein